MCKIITIAGQKGGTGKSITAVNIAASLALFEKKTLLIDCDPQGCSTQWCGISKNDYNYDLASVLLGRTKIKDAILKTRLDYLNIIPAGFSLFQVSLKLAKNPGNEKLLRLFLKDIYNNDENEYEYIIIDSPSSHSFLSVSAMTAAELLVVCMSVQQNSCLEDFHGLLKMIKHIKVNHKVALKIAGFLFNRCKTKKQITSFLSDHNLMNIDKMVFSNFIPEDNYLQKTIDLKSPALLKDIKSKAATAYMNFAQELHFHLI